MQIDLDIDAPRDGEYTRTVADVVSEGIRVLNHATFSATGSGLRWPSDVYTVLGSLEAAAAGMPQLYRQLSAWVIAENQAGHVRENANYGPHGGDANAAARALAAHLTDAAGAADRMADALRQARSDAAGLESTRPQEEGEDL